MFIASHLWPSNFKLIKMTRNEKFSSSGALATFQMLSHYLWLAAAVVDGADIKYFHRVQSSVGQYRQYQYRSQKKWLEARGSV